MNNMRNKILSLLVLLIAASGAWAQATFGVKEITPDMVPDSWNGDTSGVTAAELANWGFKEVTADVAKTWTGAPQQVTARLIYTISSGCETLDWEGGVQNGGSSYIRHNTIYLLVRNPDYSSAYDFFITTEPTTDPNTIEVTTNAETDGAYFTEASFAMPDFDATAEYELVRDMAEQMTTKVGNGADGADYRIRLKKDGTAWQLADITHEALMALITVHDGIENKNLAFSGQGAVCALQIFAIDDNGQPTGNAISFANLAPGRYVAKAVAADGTDYIGETALSNVLVLFEGYEVTVPAKEFVTYYKDEPLYADPVTSTAAQLYTISSVSDSKAVLSSAIETAPKNTPLLVYNSGDEAKTFLLIPANAEPNLSLTVYSGFQGTLEATQIAASTASQSNYALNGTAFVWVKNAVEIAANKAWLTVAAPTSGQLHAPALNIVFDDATGVRPIDNGQLTIDNWYDLSGRKVATPTKKGIYVKNGRKVVVK